MLQTFINHKSSCRASTNSNLAVRVQPQQTQQQQQQQQNNLTVQQAHPIQQVVNKQVIDPNILVMFTSLSLQLHQAHIACMLSCIYSVNAGLIYGKAKCQ